ncbi:uracil nucleotide/cysteinyl leukotriene receptor-like [Betta splendens]|uniref:Uracil nucleotide/cysteinyl leukotriene receptor-like n=1 Tax=Betta splendens TaxID=158456 RepID=A0A8M1HFD0_BETSP|nr:uracil nucleotide/cysteinyl leukotriene receptor-like [Betta splendens]
MGLPLCVAVRMLYHYYFYLSIFFVTCVSVDRYLAIVHPLRSLVLRGRRMTCLLCAAVWVSALVLSTPVASLTQIQTCPGSNRTICSLYVLLTDTRGSLPFSLLCCAIGFSFPLLSICYLGLRSVRELRRSPFCPGRYNKRRRLLSATLLLFVLVYLPYHLCRSAAIVMRAVYSDNTDSWRIPDLAFSLTQVEAVTPVCSLPQPPPRS